MTKEQKEQTIGLLFAEKCSCVVRNGDEVRIFRERGVKDLYRLLREEPQLLDGAFVADKVVGKGAAALMILGGVEELFADVVSRAALDLLAAAGKSGRLHGRRAPYHQPCRRRDMSRGAALRRGADGRGVSAADRRIHPQNAGAKRIDRVRHCPARGFSAGAATGSTPEPDAPDDALRECEPRFLKTARKALFLNMNKQKTKWKQRQ